MVGCKTLSGIEKPKRKYRKGLWSPEEDQKLRDYVLKYGHGCWSSVPANAGLQRNGKSCRLRWINYLRPGLKRGMFTAQEDQTILTLHRSLGNKWSQIAQHLSGRTDNEVKNYWHTYLKKKATKPDPKIPINSGSIDQIHDHDSPGSSLPKIMFAEWISQDNNNSGIIEDDRYDPMPPIISPLDFDSNIQNSYLDYVPIPGETFSGDYINSERSDGSATEIHRSLGFASCFSVHDNICCDEDFMYI